MWSKGLALSLVLLLAGGGSVSLADTVSGTWYDVQQQYSGEPQQTSGEPQQIEEIEVAPGVKVRADIWEDDYAPTYEDLVRVGFLPEDAREFNRVLCTWGQIKVCLSKPYHDCDCVKKGG